MRVQEQVRQIVARVLAEAGDAKPIADHDSLVVSGRMSSLDLVTVLLALEDTFGLSIDADEFDPIKFDTVDSIVELVSNGDPS